MSFEIGASITAYSQSLGKWVTGKVVNQLDNDYYTVEYDTGEFRTKHQSYLSRGTLWNTPVSYHTSGLNMDINAPAADGYVPIFDDAAYRYEVEADGKIIATYDDLNEANAFVNGVQYASFAYSEHTPNVKIYEISRKPLV